MSEFSELEQTILSRITALSNAVAQANKHAEDNIERLKVLIEFKKKQDERIARLEDKVARLEGRQW